MIVDASLFAEGERELGTGVVISPIVVNDNLVDVTIGPAANGEGAASLAVSPKTSYVRFINQVKTAPAGTRPSIRWSSDSLLPDGSHIVVASGVFPKGTAPILYSYAVPQPSRFAEVTLAEVLRDAGVAAQPRRYATKPAFVRLRSSYGPANTIAEHQSATFGNEVRVTLKVSQNLHASMTPFLLGALRGKDSSTTGFDVERDFLTSLGLDLSGAQQADGAGGDAHYTPTFMTSYLSGDGEAAGHADIPRGAPDPRTRRYAVRHPGQNRRLPGTCSRRPARSRWTTRSTVVCWSRGKGSPAI